jgi:uncharacterized protein
VTLDDLNERTLAKNDPELFFKKNTPPILIDEVQYAPELFSYIKIICDRERKPGLFWLTGSQKFHLMKNVSESLAGRVAILDLLGLSQAEIFKHSTANQPLLPTTEWLNNAREHSIKNFNLMDVYKRIWTGSFPKYHFKLKQTVTCFIAHMCKLISNVMSVRLPISQTKQGFMSFYVLWQHVLDNY